MLLHQLKLSWRSGADRGYRVVALGSSNTELGSLNHGRFNWVSWLEVSLRQHIGMHVTVTNAGIGGQCASDLLLRIDRDVAPLRPDLVIVTIGGNDYKEISVEQFRANVQRVVRSLKRLKTVPVLQTYYSVMPSPPAPSEVFAGYMAAKLQVAVAEGIPCIDSFPLMYKLHRTDPAAYFHLMLDGGHLNAIGHAVFGTLCVRAFGLPDPILPPDIQDHVASTLGDITKMLDTRSKPQNMGDGL